MMVRDMSNLNFRGCCSSLGSQLGAILLITIVYPTSLLKYYFDYKNRVYNLIIKCIFIVNCREIQKCRKKKKIYPLTYYLYHHFEYKFIWILYYIVLLFTKDFWKALWLGIHRDIYLLLFLKGSFFSCVKAHYKKSDLNHTWKQKERKQGLIAKRMALPSVKGGKRLISPPFPCWYLSES